MSRPTRCRQAFTILELLVVIAVIGILAALLLPAVQASRESARRTQCINNQKQLTMALHAFADVKSKLPPGATRDWPGWYWRGNCSAQGSGPSWIARILPYIEQADLHSKINWDTPPGKDPFNEPPDQPNQAAGKKTLSVIRCPSDPDLTRLNAWGYAPNNYVACVGGADHTVDTLTKKSGCVVASKQTAAFYINSSRYLAEFRDGLSNTLLLSECKVGKPYNLRGYTWIYGQYNAAWSFSTRLPPNDRATAKAEPFVYTYYSYYAARSYHPGGVVVSLADGSVRFAAGQIDIGIWRALGTVAGKEAVPVSF